jgi:hypothetical protein
MEGGTISGNTSKYGGGVYVSGGLFKMLSPALITGNTATKGGGVSLSDGTMTMVGGKIADNEAVGFGDEDGGGGVYVNDGSSVVMKARAEISGNRSNKHGGGVYINHGSVLADNSTITGNYAEGSGGGVYWRKKSSFTKKHGTKIRGNKAETSAEIARRK